MREKLTCVVLLTGIGLLGAQTPGPKTFSSPEVARDALLQASRRGLEALREMMGPGSAEILRTGDPVEEKELVDKFNQQAAQKVQLQRDEMNSSRVTLLVGEEEWPFAIPLIRKNGAWYFDIEEGKAEIRRRTIGANELDTIEVCRGYVEAQQIYSGTDWNGNGKLEYAAKIISTQGKKDGLFWPGEDSPIAEPIAKAIAQGYTPGGGYHGYQYKILLAQGTDAADGEQDYVVHGLMIGGFALVAWPSEYGVSGIMTFIVNQDGVVYEKDLGPHTSTLARAMTKFNPDKSWRASLDSR